MISPQRSNFISIAEIDLMLSVNEIYERVANDDVSAFLRGEIL